MLRVTVTTALAVALAACATPPGNRPPMTAESGEWRRAATDEDRGRLRDWRTAFVKALAQARAAGHGAEIDREGALMVPDAATGPSPIPNGNYKCRVTKLGAKGPGLLDYVAYPAFDCRIRQERMLQGFAKMSGSQRQVGLIFPDSALRQAFLGTLALGDEDRAMQYGSDPDRDVAGWIEKIGPNRWRVIMPYPKFESTMDVMELVPAS